MNFQFSIFPPKADPPRADNFQKKTITFLVFSLLLFYFSGYKTASASMFTRAPNNFGLVGYWSMEDGKGATVTDFSGKGNVGTMTNMDPNTDWITGKVGKALDFDGTNDRVVIGGPSSIYGLTTDLSVFAWVKTTDTSWEAFGNGAGGNGGWGVSSYSSIGASGRLSTYIGATWRFSSSAVNDGTWHHVGYTLSSSSGGTLQFYVDGAANGSAITSSGAHSGGGGTSITIGDDQGNAFPLSGQVDEARIYNRALSSADVSALYNSTKKEKLNARPGPLSSSNLVFYLKLDESSGNAADSSTAGLTFTNNSTVTYVGGKIGNAARFSGSNYLSRADSAALSPTTAATWSFWFYKTTAYSGSNNMFTSKWNFNANNGWGHRTNGTEFEATLENYNYAGITSGLGLSANTWYHAVVIFNGAGVGNSGRLKLYINGAEKTLTYTGTIPSTISDTANAFEIGGWSNIGYYFTGIIDEFGFWNKALSSDEVAILYNSGNARAYPFQTATVRKSASLNTIAPGSLVLWHTFDGPYLNTTTSTDRSGQANNGALTNGPVPNLGKIGQALKFDGINDYVISSGSTGISGDVPVTMSMWLKPTTISTAMIAANMYGGSKYFGIFLNVNGNGEIGLEGGYCGAETTAGTLKANQWQHIVVAKDAGEIVANTRIYVDGSLKSVSAGPYGTCTPTYGTGPVTIGSGWSSYTDYPFSGLIDDFRLYNKALSAAEISALYVQGGRAEAPDTIAPTISAEGRSNTNRCDPYVAYTFTWTTTELSNTAVEYGTTSSYGTTASTSNSVTSHSQAINTMSPSTLYYYRVKSTDAAGNTGYGTASSFTTTTTLPCGGP
jgi:hypothetical protein